MVTIDGDEIVSGSTIDGDEISEITMDGDVVWTAREFLEYYIEDDFAGTTTTNRDGSKSGWYDDGTQEWDGAAFRPDWEPTASNITINMEDGEMYVRDDNQEGTGFGAGTPTNYIMQNGGKVTIEMAPVDLGRHGITFISDSGGSMRFSHNRGNNSYSLTYIDESDNRTTVISGSESLGTGFSRYEITRSSNDEWEVIKDGSSLGSGTQSIDWDVSQVVIDPSANDNEMRVRLLEIE